MKSQPTILVDPLTSDARINDVPCDICLDSPTVCTLQIPGHPTTHLCLHHARQLRLGLSRVLGPRLRYAQGPPVQSIEEFAVVVDICRSFWDTSVGRCVPSSRLKSLQFSFLMHRIKIGQICYRILHQPPALPKPNPEDHPF